MSKTGYFKLGVFVLVGVALFVGGVVVWGASGIFEEVVYGETYFVESVQGLDVGSPVKYRGVKLGSVVEVALVAEKYPMDMMKAENLEYGKYVYVKFSFEPLDKSPMSKAERRARTEHIIERGFRLQLKSQGITGLAFLEGNYFEPELYPPLDLGWEPEESYVPSAPSTLSQLSESLVSTLKSVEGVDFAELSEHADKLLVRLDETVVSMDISGIRARLEHLIDSVEKAIAGADLGRLSAKVAGLLDDTRVAVNDLDTAGIRQDIGVVVEDTRNLLQNEDLNKTLQELGSASAQLRMTLKRIHGIVATNQGELATLMMNLRIITEHVSQVSANAEEYPSHIILGLPPDPKDIED
ncbi:MAG: MlaD family protein [Planctomycetota bacterium]|nr:MlaD family protein [Planctomycetota bacterium]